MVTTKKQIINQIRKEISVINFRIKNYKSELKVQELKKKHWLEALEYFRIKKGK